MRPVSSRLIASVLGLVAGATCALVVSHTVFAKTPDGEPPAEESVCEGETGALYGLCVSYCEAMDCGHPDQHADDRACNRVLDNYRDKSGGEDPPCGEEPHPTDTGGADDTGCVDCEPPACPPPCIELEGECICLE